MTALAFDGHAVHGGASPPKNRRFFEKLQKRDAFHGESKAVV
jgi:hypothetical protein